MSKGIAASSKGSGNLSDGCRLWQYLAWPHCRLKISMDVTCRVCQEHKGGKLVWCNLRLTQCAQLCGTQLNRQQDLLGCTNVITVKTEQSHRVSYSLLLLMATLSYSIPLVRMGAYMRKDLTTCGYLQAHWGEEKLNASSLLYFLWHVHRVTSGCVKIYYVTWCSVTWWH